ncbi:hypothetical protein P4O66_015592, partial [Electrophorus voltai]
CSTKLTVRLCLMARKQQVHKVTKTLSALTFTQPEMIIAVVECIKVLREESKSGELKGIFMQERDATNFFRRRNRRAVKSQDEINAELRQRLAADERKREYHEERMNQFETYAEEEHD